MKKVALGFTLILSMLGVNAQNSTAIDKKVNALLKQMTLEEKVGQMCQLTLNSIGEGPDIFTSVEPYRVDDGRIKRAIVDYKVGSILNTSNNRALSLEQWHQVAVRIHEEAMKTRMKIPVIFGIDAIHGVNYTQGSTLFPQELAMAATWNRDLVQRGAAITSYEMRASSIPWNFSPVLDLGLDPRWPRFWETFGEDPYLTSEMGVQMIKGYQGAQNNVAAFDKGAACLKHFLGYSVPVSGKDRTPALIPENYLREYHLPSFKAAIEQGAKTLMVNSGIINGESVHASRRILTDLLKKELKFKGVVVTDWADIENLYKRDRIAATPKEAVKLSVNAGIDMSMVPYSVDFCDYLIQLVKEGEVKMERIDDAVSRILKLKYELGLFEKPITDYKEYTQFGSKEFEKSSYSAACEAITLLKNENVLPLSKGVKVLVTGPNANSMRTLNGGWSYSWQGEKTEEFAQKYNTILEAVTSKFGKENVLYEAGVEYNMKGVYHDEIMGDFNAVQQKAAQADYIIACIGENSYTEKPGDLQDLYLSENQENLVRELAKSGKPIILILNEGRPRIISRIERLVKGVVMAYLPGNFGGDALADVLAGDVNPSGKLPFTYPAYPNSLIAYHHKPAEEQKKSEGAYDYNGEFTPQYPFGFGLSYTSFTYSQLALSGKNMGKDGSLEVTVKVKNSGSRDGMEVVKLFVSDVVASLTPDVKRLKGFQKIALKPGEEKLVTFRLTPSDLKFVDLSNRSVAEKGEFVVEVANLSSSFNLTENILF
ncbi:glycoside hydrolase family 3 N-terminal domain-containing protein [Alistipes sp. ZOR0009]|uniref:glycoside hydrolase family 3 N-terminal domain-containing protein n=1 Tax=Alistipes sp. ZOR0009 TaxID=1339253 RepID=UPI0006455B4A|nr:glycoside hydrolase family 3 N-terminal domain-containing protein [Alistipes sp. ZOR0009]